MCAASRYVTDILPIRSDPSIRISFTLLNFHFATRLYHDGSENNRCNESGLSPTELIVLTDAQEARQ